MTRLSSHRSDPEGRPVRPEGGRLVEEAVEHIENGVRAGVYPPGHRLVEADVAKQSGLNIGPVREALRLLAGEGLVDIRPFRGASVKRMSPDELVQVYQALKGIVYMSLTLAAPLCESLTAQRRLTSAMNVVRSASRRTLLPDFLYALAEYYFALHEIAGNTYLTILIKRLHLGLVHRELANLLGGVNRDEVVEVYKRATEALLKGDSQLAIRVKFEYFDRLIKRIRDLDVMSVNPRLLDSRGAARKSRRTKRH